MSGPLKLGMVGGGRDAFIGAVHRIASRIDDSFVFVAGCLSSTPEKSKASGADLGLDPERCYGTFEEMAKAEAAREDGIDAVSIVTPNHVHYPAAKAFIEAGIPVICDKPMTTTLADAQSLAQLVAASGKPFVLTHNYTGYPMIRQARDMVASGELGAVRVVQVEYAQDWLSTKLEDSGMKQAAWRTDPAQSGPVGATGDIGTHAYNIASFVTGTTAESLAADLHTFVEGRRLDDNLSVMLRYPGGGRGMLWASQVAPGNENALKLRVYGEKGGLEWAQEDPNYLHFAPLGEAKRLLTRAGPGANEAAAAVSRIPPGHPEGYLEGFATLYKEAAALIRGTHQGPQLAPTVQDGVAGMAFIEAVLESSKQNGAWVMPKA